MELSIGLDYLDIEFFVSFCKPLLGLHVDKRREIGKEVSWLLLYQLERIWNHLWACLEVGGYLDYLD